MGGLAPKYLDPLAVHVPHHRTTTAHLQAVYPFMSSPGLGSRGVYIGREIFGGSFCYDPWELYAQGVLTNPNILVLGQVGRGKSSLVKSLLLRQQVFGRKAAVLDPKGEYAGLAAAIGAPVIKVEPGGAVMLNPLDATAGGYAASDEDVFRRRTALIQALAGTSLGRALRPEERVAIDLAITHTAEKYGSENMILPMLVDWLLEPSAEAAYEIRTSLDELTKSGRDVALELRRMCHGDLKGMFDGPTNVNIDWNGALVVVDLSAVFGSSALGLIMTCATAWLQAAISRPDGKKRFVVLDEAWAVLNNVSVARWLQQSYKLSRGYGVSNVAIMHRLSDLQASGNQGSEAFNLAKGLLSDTETRIIYGQPHSEIELAVEMLGLTGSQAELLPQLKRGQALWKVGRDSFLVQHQLGNSEKTIVDTDAQMHSDDNYVQPMSPEEIALAEQEDIFAEDSAFAQRFAQVAELRDQGVMDEADAISDNIGPAPAAPESVETVVPRTSPGQWGAKGATGSKWGSDHPGQSSTN